MHAKSGVELDMPYHMFAAREEQASGRQNDRRCGEITEQPGNCGQAGDASKGDWPSISKSYGRVPHLVGPEAVLDAARSLLCD